ncbi:hypothetical protein F4810DRAFT_682499 [Camillea tinctor]|nr:hypothetical protein F4810DRAFT_682499 [Camillea tinctor]
MHPSHDRSLDLFVCSVSLSSLIYNTITHLVGGWRMATELHQEKTSQEVHTPPTCISLLYMQGIPGLFLLLRAEWVQNPI